SALSVTPSRVFMVTFCSTVMSYRSAALTLIARARAATVRAGANRFAGMNSLPRRQAQSLFRCAVHELDHVPLELVERLTLDVHHVSGIELAGGGITAQARVEPQVVERVVHGIERGGKIIVTFHHKKFHIRVLDKGAAQIGADIGKALFRRSPVPLLEAAAQN